MPCRNGSRYNDSPSHSAARCGGCVQAQEHMAFMS
uniref:Uncharacterized protein n=1 Tax=Brassica oleracea TaxID=3712 RepID=A0A3P6FNA1_BRAOL|nr:unnamed protein product [Brassica oleracea]